MLSQYVDSFNGVMTISEEGLQKLTAVLEAEVKSAQLNTLKEDIDLTETEIDNAKKKEGKTLKRSYTDYEASYEKKDNAEFGGTQFVQSKAVTRTDDVTLEDQKEIFKNLVNYIDDFGKVN